MAPEMPLLRGMSTGLEVLLGLPDASGIRPCDQTHLKTALCHTRTLGWAYVKYQCTNRRVGAHFHLLGHTSAVLRGMPMGPEVLLGLPYAFGLRPFDWTHLKTALCHTRTLGGAYVKYQCTNQRDTITSDIICVVDG